METGYFYEVERGHGLPHDPLSAIVAPRPLAWISTRSTQGIFNLVPYSYFTMVSSQPPIVCFSSQGWKGTVCNAAETGEFVVNGVGRSLAEAMNRTSFPSPAGIDVAQAAGIEWMSSRLVASPRVADAPSALECRLLDIRRLDDLDGAPLDWHLVLGQIIGVHIASYALRDGCFDPVGAGIIARCGDRDDYTQVDALFKMARPTDIIY